MNLGSPANELLCRLEVWFRIKFILILKWPPERCFISTNITRKKTSIVPGTKTVLRTARKSCGECSPEVPGVSRQAKSADFNNYLFILKILVQKGQKYLLFRLKKIHIANF